jgi:hypothetical protein
LRFCGLFLVLHNLLSTGISSIYQKKKKIHQELPERLLLTYKPEESEEILEPAPVEEEKVPVEEPVLVPPVTEVVSPPPKAEVPDTGDLLVGKITN